MFTVHAPDSLPVFPGTDRRREPRAPVLPDHGRLYDELQGMARARLRRSGELTFLDTTALVHEACMHFQQAGGLGFAHRQAFLARASQVMRTVVVDTVRSHEAQRSGGQTLHVTLNVQLGESGTTPAAEVLRLNDALQALARLDARLGQVVELRCFGGLSEAEIAECLDVTERTVQRDWQKARLFLSMALR